jgi:hypothetical protein
MIKSVKVKTDENEFAPMKKNGYAICWENIIEQGRTADVMFKIVNEDVFRFFYDSKHLQCYSDMWVNAVEVVKDEFLKGKGKGKKKLSKSDISSISAMATHIVFLGFDDLERGDERIQQLKDVCETYFYNKKELMVAGIAFAFLQLKNDDIFTIHHFPIKAALDKAHKQNLKLMGTDEWDNIIVPADVKFAIGKVKAHLDLYMWDEFIKAEYNTYKLAGYSDDDIIDVLNDSHTILAFCAYCEGYAEGAEESVTESNK